MQTETRGRKKLPDSKKKKPITLFLSNEEIDLLGGGDEAKMLLNNYSKLKIKQNAKKIITNL